MNRRTKLLLNSMTGVIRQLTTLVCGFVLPRYMLIYFGSSVNGLVSSIAHFLSFITLLELGIGPVIQSNLYKPLANKDDAQISRIVKSSKRFFYTIGVVFLVYIAVLSIVYPRFINSSFDATFTASLLVIISISTIAEYFVGMSYQLLLNADQKAYIQQTIGIITVIINTVLAVTLMKCGASIHLVKLASASIFVIRPFALLLYVDRHYNLDRHVEIKEEPIKQKWNGFSQHLAAVICQNIDVVLLTFFSTLENVSVYNVFYLVTHGVTQIIMTAATGLESLFGNMIAKNENMLLCKTFEMVEFIVHNIVVIIFTITAITITPFVKVYTYGVNDANYDVPLFGFLLVIAYAAQCLRVPYFRMIKAAGHFKQTQNGAYVSAILNIIFSIILVFKYGLIGVAIGTLVAMVYHTCYFVIYLKNNIINRAITPFLIYMLFDIIVLVVSIFVTQQFKMNIITYGSWLVYAIKTSGLVLAITIILDVLFFRKKIVDLFLILRKKH